MKMNQKSILKDAFGKIITPFNELPFEYRVVLFQAWAGQLVSGTPDRHVSQQIGAAIIRWIQRGGSLESHLSLKPSRGSRSSVQRVAKFLERDRQIVTLANIVGSDVRALRILAGTERPPADAVATLTAIRRFGKPPACKDAVSRARRHIGASASRRARNADL